MSTSKMITAEEAENVWRSADLLWSEQQVERAIVKVADEIEVRLGHENPLLITLMNGGLFYAARLMARLQFPLQQDFVHATRYGNETHGSELKWRVGPPDTVKGRKVLLVDDILDEGKTLQETRDACLKRGADEVLTTVLVEKNHDRKYDPSFHADFTALGIEDRYVFGYGMDYKGYLRNALGIFAVKGL